MAFIMSSKAHANIKAVDASVTIKKPDVKDYIYYKNVHGHSKWGAVFPEDEEIFAHHKVNSISI